MPLIRKGSCNHCGKCCKPPVMVENPCIERSEDRCKFYVDSLVSGNYGHCLILSRGNKPIAAVKDRFGNKINEAQIKWFEQNCLDYPIAVDVEKGHQIPADCGFNFGEI